MSNKQFNVPPVIFPTSTNQRRPTAPFQPRPTTNPIPFMSFEIGSATTSSFPPAPTTNFNNFDQEPPLLEELGINTKQIWNKTTSLLNPLRIKNLDLHEDADLSGPVMLIMAFGLFQLLAGKIHFGIILGWVTVSALFLYVVSNMLAGRNGTLDLYRCVSLIGYCMLPLVILSALSLFLPQGGFYISVIALFFVAWSTKACTMLLVHVASWDQHPGLLAYVCFLIYSLFSLLVVF